MPPSEFDKNIAELFRPLGYEISIPPDQSVIELRKDGEKIALLVRNPIAKVNLSEILRFQHLLESSAGSAYKKGFIVSTSGFSKPALIQVHAEQTANLELIQYSSGEFIWEYPIREEQDQKKPVTVPAAPRQLKYFGIFTSKGGVGKTTTAAHLAGAFALMGHDVILLDLDPDKNLRKLFRQDPTDDEGDCSLWVPPRNKDEQGAVITVLNKDQWDERRYEDVKVVICDCSPVLSENPRYIVERFDYCIIPTMLNPLGIAKHADVITRTFRQIRQTNPKAEMFAFINGFNTDSHAERRNELLLSHLKKHIDTYTQEDPKCRFIHPDDAKVRYSTALLYWGYHIIEGTKPQLAFREVAGKSHPRTDFLQLAEYLETHTEIDKLRAEAKKD